MLIDTIFPNKAILEIAFLNQVDFYSIYFHNNAYLIVGKDKDIENNLIGITNSGEVYYLTLDDSRTCYVSKDIDTFVNELLLFDRFVEKNMDIENQDELLLSQLANSFRNELLKLDKSAFRDGAVSTFWSEVCEEIEYGILI
mgnify:CR=1 FL=1